MTKINIISGFLGAGKTTLIKKLLSDVFQGQKLVLIENEFGEIGIDSRFLKDSGVEITEMNSGCICCSLVGDFGTALKEVLEKFHPDRIIIEPSGVGKLSDVIKAVEHIALDSDIVLDAALTVADGSKCKIYMKNFGEFFNNQIEYADIIVLSRTQNMKQDKLEASVALIQQHNKKAPIITTPWDQLNGQVMMSATEKKNSLENRVKNEFFNQDVCDYALASKRDHGTIIMTEEACPECGHVHEHHHDEHDSCEHEHHHHDEHDSCEHEHHHHDDHDSCEHEHHHDEHDSCEHEHHHHDEHDSCEHEHHHHDEHCGCGHDHSHGHGHHHAEDVFTSWGKETPHKYSKEVLESILDTLANSTGYGVILRAKGIIQDNENSWMQFDLVPGEYEIRTSEPDYTGRLCVIGAELEESKLEQLFQLQ